MLLSGDETWVRRYLQFVNDMLFTIFLGTRLSHLDSKFLLKYYYHYETDVCPLSHGSLRITTMAALKQMRSSCLSFLYTLFGRPNAVKYRGSRRLPNHYVMCRAASSGAGDSAESCWGEFLVIIH